MVIGAACAIAAASLAALAAAAPAHAGRLLPAGGIAARSAPGTAGTAGLAVLDLVMLVDESGSETPQKVTDEKATVGMIIQSQLNPASRVTVIGFGGVNGVAPNEVATDVACVPTTAGGAANLAYLSTCYDKLGPRGEKDADDTDYAAALTGALTYLSPASTATPPSPAKAIKVILMMTDGAVDVHRDPQRGATPAARLTAENAAVSKELGIAKADGVQFWPLGFGTDIGSNVDHTNITEQQALSYLNDMAARGASDACPGGSTTSYPHATWVNNPDDASSALDVLYAAAGCLGENSVTKPLAGGQSVTLQLTIPPLVSAAAISVARGNAGVLVVFTPPEGPPVTDSPAISGHGAPVEVLHLANVTAADIGTWNITLTAPPAMASELARATAFWQGAVRARVTANPLNAIDGQKIGVTVSLLGPGGPITSAAALSSVAVGIIATGTDLTGTQRVPVSPVRGHPGEWAGTFTAPDKAGTLHFQGTVTLHGGPAGDGLYVTQVPQSVTVSHQVAGLAIARPPGFLGQWWPVLLAVFIVLVTIVIIALWRRVRRDDEDDDEQGGGSGGSGGIGLSALMDELLGGDAGPPLSSAGPASGRVAEAVTAPASAQSVLAAAFWWLFTHSAAYADVTKRLGASRTARPVVVSHAEGTRFDLLLLDPRRRRGRRRQEYRERHRQGDAVRLDGEQPYSPIDPSDSSRQRLTGFLRYTGLSELLESRTLVDSARELAASGRFGVAIVKAPVEVPTCAPAPAVPVLSAAKGRVATLGAFVSEAVPDAVDTCLATTAYHAVRGRARWLKVDGARINLVSRHKISDSCLVRVKSSMLNGRNRNGLRGPLTFPPRFPWPAFFERAAADPTSIHTRLIGYDLMLLDESSYSQEIIRVYTDSDTVKGDSGTALTDEEGFIIGFAYKRSSAKAMVKFSSWVWAHQVYMVHDILGRIPLGGGTSDGNLD